MARKNQVSLLKTICHLVREGKLPQPFRRKDVYKYSNGEFALTYLNTFLANNCEGTGNYVNRGQHAWFRRLSKGLYEVIDYAED